MNPPLRDRLWSFKALLLVALATLIIGGFSGAGVAALVSHDHDGGRARVERELLPGMPYGPPGQRRDHKPWQHRHFYWNDGPQSIDPGMPTPGPSLKLRPRDELQELEKRVEELEKKAGKK